MDDATERRILYLMCLAGTAIALVALYAGVIRSDTEVTAVALALIGLMVATAIAAWRSGLRGDVQDETAEDPSTA
ncbi:MAG: hypothetical protein ABFC89_05665 [Methanospirillum sp.]